MTDQDLLTNGSFVGDAGSTRIARVSGGEVAAPAAPWLVWHEGTSGETVAETILPSGKDQPGVLAVRTTDGRGGVRQIVQGQAEMPLTARVWVLVRSGVASLDVDTDGSKDRAARSTLVGSWELLERTVDRGAGPPVFTVEGNGRSEFLVGTAQCVPGPVDARDQRPLPLPPAVRCGTVSGRVTRGGAGVSFGRIVLAARRLRGEIPIVETAPGPDGRYQARYDWADHRSPALAVRMLDDAGQTLAWRELSPDLADEAAVDLTLDGAEQQTEFEQVLAAVTPHLDGSNLGDLEVKDVRLMAELTAEEPSRLHALISAAQLAEQTGADSAVLYALARTPGWPEALLTGRFATGGLVAAVEAAAAAAIVPGDAVDKANDAASSLRAAAAGTMLRDERTGPLLELAVPSTAERATLVERYLSHDGPDSSWWDELTSVPATSGSGADVRYALRLAELTDHDLPLIGELFHRRRTGEGLTVEELAGANIGEWRDLLASVQDRGDGPTGDAHVADSLDDRAAALAREFERAYPSAAFSRRLVRAGTERHEEEVVAFFRDHPNVDLAVDDVDKVAEGGAPEGVKAKQRLFKVTPRYDHVSVLHQHGYRSAVSIARVGRAAFIGRNAGEVGGETAAGQIFDRAARVAIAATGLYLENGAAATAALPRVLQASADSPDWSELFGDQLSFSGVDACRSVFSPAAYLADLFGFLEGRPSKENGVSALDVLLRRRPDIQWLKLSCANSDVAVPYIDLVNESLESAVLADPTAPVQVGWVSGYPDDVPGSGPVGGNETSGDEGWHWVSDPVTPSQFPNCHFSAPAPGEHFHGLEGAVQPMAVRPGDLLETWVYLAADNPPDEIMLEWAVGADTEHRAYWTNIRKSAGVVLGSDGLPSRWPMGGLPDPGRWTRLVVAASAVGLEGKQVTGVRFIVFTAEGAGPTPALGAAWWGRMSCIPNAPPTETVGSAEQRATDPQAITDAAYQPLSNAVYPQQELPFDLGITTARIAMGQLNVPRSEVMEALHNGSSSDAMQDPQICAELLGLTPAERAIVTGTDGHPEPVHWGLVADPAHPDDWFKELERASEFLTRSGLTLEQIRTPPGANFTYGIGPDLADASDPSSLTLVGVSEATLPKVRRFLRLWRKLGWDHGDLERIIWNLGPRDPQDISDDLLVTLALIQRLRDAIGTGPSTVMNWWTPKLDASTYVDPRTYPPDGPGDYSQSPYARAFLGATDGAADSAFALNNDRDELGDLTHTIKDQLPSVLAALGLSASDLTLLARSELTGLPDGPADIDALKLNLGNLSALYRCATFAKATGIAISDFLILRNLSGINPLDGGSKGGTLGFVAALDDVRAAGLSLGELQHLLADIATPGEPVIPSEQQLTALSNDIQAGLLAIRRAHQPAPDPGGEVTLAQLSAISGLTSPELAVAALNGTATTTQPLPSAPSDLESRSGGLLSYDEATQRLSFTAGAMTSAQRTALQALASDAPYETALGTLFDATRAPVSRLLSELGLDAARLSDLVDQLTDPGARFAWLLGPVTEMVWRRLGQLLVQDKVSAATGIAAELCAPLIGDWLHVTDDNGQPLSVLDALLDVGVQPLDEDGPATVPARNAAYKCFKVAQLISSLRLTSTEVEHAVTVGRHHGWIDLDAIPVSPSTAPNFAGWRELAGYARLRSELADADGTLVRVMAAAAAFTDGDPAASLPNTLKQLSDAFGWQLDTLTEAASALGLTYPGDFEHHRGIARLKRLLGIVARTGAAVGQLVALAQSDLSGSDGLAAWQLLAARYDPATWASAGPILQNVLRERRRDALLGFLQANPGRVGLQEAQSDSNRLLEWLLVDVEVGSCRQSTRLDLAINSVQLYVQRCLLGLEPNVGLTANDAAEWLWLGTYQSWVASRKIFVYPENWLDPSMRSDVTELYQQLQKQLLQSDLTNDGAEAALSQYLAGLDEIANMEPSAVIRDISNTTTSGTNSSGNNIETTIVRFGDTHFVSRTRSSPHTYHHRTWSARELRWTPWTRITVDVDADNLVPALLNNQFYLFWPEFTDRAPEDIPDPSANGMPPARSRQLSLAWTRLHNGGWAPKRVSTPVAVDQGADLYDLPLSSFFLLADESIRNTSADIALASCWFLGPWTGDASQWNVSQPGELTFSPRTLAVAATPYAGTDPLLPTAPPLSIPGGLPKRDYYYVLTRVRPGPNGWETAPSPELHVALTDEVVGKNNTGATIRLSWPASAGDVFHLYKGVRSREENMYFELTAPAGATSVSFTDDGNQQVAGYGPPVWEGRREWKPPQSGCSPNHQAFLLASSGPLTAGLWAWTGDPSQPPTASSPNILGKVDPSTRVLASPHQSDGSTDGVEGFAPLVGMTIELGNRSFFVGQDKDLTDVTVVTNQSVTNTQARRVLAVPPASGSGDVEATSPLVALPAAATTSDVEARFYATYHPWVKTLIAQLNAGGVSALLDRDVQLHPEAHAVPPVAVLDFSVYQPNQVATPYPVEDIDFGVSGAYGTYNWELFFHIPLLMARSLMTSRRFAEARKWLHYIFDPTDASTAAAPQKYWQTGVLFNYSGSPDPDASIARLLDLLVDPGANPDQRALAQHQVDLWRQHPADPDTLARLRLSAYQKSVVMTYLDNLIAWGDDLFSQATAETITQATQLYVLAAELLGPRPDLGTAGKDTQPISLGELRSPLGSFADPLVNLENRLAVWTSDPAPGSYEAAPAATLTPTLYFPVPVNDKLIGYWSTVEDRLYKVRHCLDIQGQQISIPEFGAPIEPGALLAGALGQSLAEAVALPQYRFITLLQKALELAEAVKALGANLLAAIEKRDAEALARIRAGQETQVLLAARDVRLRQIDEAQSAITALQRSSDIARGRSVHYHGLLAGGLSEEETQQLAHLQLAALLQVTAQGFEVLNAMFSAIPEFSIGIAGMQGSPQINASAGGQQLAAPTEAFSRLLSLLATVESHQATMTGLTGGYARRAQDWSLQAEQADKELTQIAAQIDAAQIRHDIAQKELANHDKQVSNAQAIEAFLSAKFSNTELYEWMIGQISTVYYQGYQLALDMARRTQRAYQHELADQNTTFIGGGYWNSLSRGLLAGEQLSHDLRRMESAYLERNRREFELTKHVSLALTDPVALLKLRQTGDCFVELPETLFDLDYPGHYLRRLKSVALSIPCVTGPFGGVNCTLTMLQNGVRNRVEVAGGYVRQAGEDGRFSDGIASAQTIVTSGGQGDTGLFETNLRDERYLPFEGAGAISRWHVQLPAETNRLRRDSITDVVLHIRYTARDGGPTLKEAAKEAVVAKAYENGLRLLSLRQNLTDRWAQYATWADSGPTDALIMTLPLSADLFPAQAPASIGVSKFQLLLLTAAALPSDPTIGVSSPNAAAAAMLTLTPNSVLGGLPQGVKDYGSSVQALGEWTLSFPAKLAALGATDVVIIVDYAPVS